MQNVRTLLQRGALVSLLLALSGCPGGGRAICGTGYEGEPAASAQQCRDRCGAGLGCTQCLRNSNFSDDGIVCRPGSAVASVLPSDPAAAEAILAVLPARFHNKLNELGLASDFETYVQTRDGGRQALVLETFTAFTAADWRLAYRTLCEAGENLTELQLQHGFTFTSQDQALRYELFDSWVDNWLLYLAWSSLPLVVEAHDAFYTPAP